MSNVSSSDVTLFSDALQRPAAERAGFLDQACAGDVARRARLDALLRAHESSTNILPNSVVRCELPPRGEEAVGGRIGRYKLLLKLGEGGCGVVFMAEQDEPVRRRVALKVIKAGMDTREVIARFEAERQALAIMDHPGICKVLDAGATATGRPFFVMELVRGVRITKFCDENHLSIPARLELFMQVCHAVQHAHHKGIIHRDLKPSNILVTIDASTTAPKVIDFGIAKAMQGRLTDATLVTAFEQFMGTPAYMSPEQAEMSGLDIDTRSDVYSLGVLLYELLAGRTPFDPQSLGHASREELRRIIREVEPRKPSSHLATMAAADQTIIAQWRATDSTRLRATLAGDLDCIVMKALEKSRARRYESPNALCADLERYLHHDAVLARPPSTLYRVGRLLRRHRVGFAAATTIALSLVAATIVSVWQAVLTGRAEHQAQLGQADARRRQEQAEDLITFMLGDLRNQLERVGRLDVLEAVGKKSMAYFSTLDARDLNDAALIKQAEALRQIGEIRVAQAQYPEAMRAFTTAFARAAALTTRHPNNAQMCFERGQAEYWIGFVHWKQSEFLLAQKWLTCYRDTSAALVAMEPVNQKWRAELASGQHNLAVLRMEQGDFEVARADFTAKLATLRDMVAINPGNLELRYRVTDTESWLGSLAERRGDFREAIARFAGESAGLDEILKVDPNTMRWRFERADSLSYQASMHMITGQYTVARSLQTEARRLMDALTAHDPANREWSFRSHQLWLREAAVERAQGNVTAAEEMVTSVRIALEKMVEAVPANQGGRSLLAAAWRMEAEMREVAGRSDSLEAMDRAVELSEALVRSRALNETTAVQCAITFAAAAKFAASQGRNDTSIAYARKVLELLATRRSHPNEWGILDPSARALALLGRHDESRTLIDRLHQLGYRPLTPWPNIPVATLSSLNQPQP